MNLILFWTVTFGSLAQTDNDEIKIYDFFNNIVLRDIRGDVFLIEDASPQVLLNYKKDSIDLDLMSCFFVDNKYYYDTVFWAENFSVEDKNYMIAQIHNFKNYKWDRIKIKKNINVISKQDVKKYSRKVMKYWNKRSSKSKDFKLLIEKYEMQVKTGLCNKMQNIEK